MKKFLTFIYLLVSLFSFSQKKNMDEIQFAVNCGDGAQTSKEIQTFQKLNNLKDYSTIRKNLFEGADMELVLSAIILKHYYSNNLVELTQAELDKINQIAKSKRKFSLCFTCTFHDEGTLKQLFTKKQALYDLIKESIINSL